ncbi:hypothetical protein IFM89_011147 [Coptis chinensis]|uniref:Uncharacterized protein n=1 Tax=Coptis chinensis TaxID=261450 RepID=A0A835HQ15_9MAGN|nr:hypothetical protein IFM89_011147 [Coptis chinensis]
MRQGRRMGESSALTRAVNVVFRFVRVAEFEILFLLFLAIAFLLFKDLELIEYVKYTCPTHLYGMTISPPVARQIVSAIKVILGEDGSSRGM